METKFKHNDVVRVIGTNPPVIGELVDIIPIGVFNGRYMYKYKVWVRYSNKFLALDEQQLELYSP